MNVLKQLGSIVAVGLLTLQLVVVSPAQQIAPQPDGTAMAQAARERSPKGTNGFYRDDLAGRGTVQPGKADDTGDPSYGGERHPLYRLYPLDVIEINFTLSPEFNQTLTVQPDGFVFLHDVGSIFAAGLTVAELGQAVVRAYSGILHDPDVSINLKDFQRPYFLASGQVARPGKYELRGDLTVNDAVAMAGGFTSQAKHSQVVLFRRVSAGVAETHLVDLKNMLQRKDLREDLHLESGDFVYVPQSRISEIRKYVPASALSWYLNPLQF